MAAQHAIPLTIGPSNRRSRRLTQSSARFFQLPEIELNDEVPGVDNLPRANVRDPIVGKAAPYDRE